MSPTPRPALFFSPRPHLLPLLLAILLLPVGCAKVQPEPFAKFAEGVELAKVTMDKTAADYSAQYRLRYVREQSANLKANTVALFLTPKGNFTVSYGVLTPETGAQWIAGLREGKKLSEITKDGNKANLKPLVIGFVLAKEMENILNKLNKAFADYAQALVLLSKFQMSDQAISQVGKAFEGPFSEFLKIYPNAIPTEMATGTSTLLAKAFGEAIRLKQIKALVHGLEESQPMVDAYSSACREALLIQSSLFKQVYADQFETLSGEFAQETTLATRQTKITKILALNEEFIQTMKILEALFEYYTILPQAHMGLAKGLKENPYDISSAERIFQYGKNIYDLYVTAKTRQPVAAQPSANPAS